MNLQMFNFLSYVEKQENNKEHSLTAAGWQLVDKIICEEASLFSVRQF